MTEPVIQYSVKEVLDRIERKLDQYSNSLTDRINGHEGRIKALEDAHIASEKLAQARSDWRRWLIPTVISLGATVAMIFAVWHP